MNSSQRNIFLFKINSSLIIIVSLLIGFTQPLSISAMDASSSTENNLTGKASWYDFKPGLFAASNIYPVGQKVRVYHLASGKTVDVTINDYGPDPKIHPDRVIDLQKEAFLKLATLGTGVITVRLEPIFTNNNQPIVTTSKTSTSNNPTISPTRDLAKEKIALQQFTKQYKRLPKSSADWQILNDLAYASKSVISPTRDLAKEKIALQQFTKQYKRLPKSSADWQILNDLAYASKSTKTTTDFQKLTATNQDATSIIVLDTNDNQILWQKDAQKIVPIASLTKMVAVKTFLDTKPNLEKVVTYSYQDEQEITKYCSLAEAALLKLKDGDQLKVKDLVYSALVGSANNAVESLVRISDLSRAEFIKKMNTNAKQWGAINTKFIEPTGLSTDNVSTAKDYALILKTVSQDANIKKISTTATYRFTTTNTKQSHTINNTNKLLREGQFSLQSSKTGYLIEAGHCLAMAAQNKDTQQNFIVVVLGSPSWSRSYETASQILSTALN